MKNYSIIFSKKIKRNRKLLFIVSIVLSLTSILVESLTLSFIDNAILANVHFITKNCLLLLVMYIIVSVMVYVKKYLENYMDKKGKFEGQVDIFKNVLEKEMLFFSKQETGVLLHNITSDIYEAMPWYCYGQLQYYLEILNLLAILIFMMYIEIHLSVIVLILVGVSILLSNRMSIFLGKKNNEKQIVNSELNQLMVETVKSMGSIVQLNKRNYFERKYETYMDQKYKPIIEHVILGQALYISQLIFSQEIIPFLVLFMGMIFTALGQTTIGTTIIMMNLTVRISKSVQILGNLLPKKHASKEIYNRIKLIYELPNDEDDICKLSVPTFEKLEIEIDKYVYPDTKKIAINDIKLKIEKTDLVSLNGESGKGKTTLVKLISRLLPIEQSSCKIRYNGKDIEGFRIKDYYKHVLQVGQESLVIEGTLEENLLLSDLFSKEELDEVIYTCHLESFINEHGMNYYIKENGKNISGGERQRIGLARILLRKPELLILDEVTSALNEEIRDEIVKRIVSYKEKYNLTIIVISHNTDFRKYSNKIYQL